MGDFLFIILALLLVRPWLGRVIQAATRRALIRQIEIARGSRVILLVHRQEPMSLLGMSFGRFIGIEEAEQIILAVRTTASDVPIDIVLHTPGGLALPSVQIARALSRHPAKVTAFVPHHALSGGTLIALAADEIVMNEHAVLGPVDPLVGQTPAASVLKVLEQKPVEKVDDQTLILADQARKGIAQVQTTIRELLRGRFDDERCAELARLLCEGTWTHDYPISLSHARAIGLNVTAGMPDAVDELVRLYPGPAGPQAVEYLPAHRSDRAVSPQGTFR